jgi:O-antigen/teichoic acid export membrane protein
LKIGALRVNFLSLVQSFATKGTFSRNVLTLLSGSVLAQIIPIAISPILSHLYKPAEFGLFTVFQALVTVASVAGTLRFQTAILLPKEDHLAGKLLLLCLLSASVMGLLFGVFLIGFRDFWASLFGADGLNSWMILAPICIFVAAAYTAFYTWFNRLQLYDLLAKARIIQGLGFSLVTVLLGLVDTIGAGGLILGFFCGQVLSTGFLIFKWSRTPNLRPLNFSITELFALAKTYRGFPIYSLPADVISAFANHLPVFLLSAHFGQTVTGFYDLTYRITLGPISLVSSAILDVFRERAAKDFQKKGQCTEVYKSTMLLLTAVSLPTFLIFYPFAPFLFTKIFGDEWRTAGIYAQILTPLFALRVIASPLSYVVYIAEKQKYDLIWQIAVLVSAWIAFAIGQSYNDEKISLRLFCTFYSVLYIVYLYVNYQFAKGRNQT